MTSTAAEEAPAAQQAQPALPATAGAALRRARESRGLHIAALAAMLKVPQSKLEALEADRHQDLPDATFARALARAVCRALKVDAEPILALLPRGSEAALDRVTPGLNQPFRERATSQEPLLSPQLFKSPVMLGVAALLLAALLVYLVPAAWVDEATARLRNIGAPAASGELNPPAEAASAVPGEPVAAPAPQASEPALAAVTPAQSGLPASLPAATTATTGATSPAPTATAPAPAPAPVAATVLPPAANVPQAAGGAPLRVKVSQESWVEVVDAQGQLLLSKLMRPGDQIDLSGAAPLKLRVGNVAGTELVFRGQPVDLAARSRDNVARFELN